MHANFISALQWQFNSDSFKIADLAGSLEGSSYVNFYARAL